MSHLLKILFVRVDSVTWQTDMLKTIFYMLILLKKLGGGVEPIKNIVLHYYIYTIFTYPLVLHCV